MTHYHMSVLWEVDGDLVRELYHTDHYERAAKLASTYQAVQRVDIRAVQRCNDPDSVRHVRLTG